MSKETPIIETDVVILGAGLAGLAAAAGVLAHGEKPVLIEKEETVGGMCRSIRKDGFIFDLGGHRFLPHRKETADYVRGLFSDNGLILRVRKSQIYLNEKFLLYPPEALDILKNLGMRTSFDCAVQGLYARLRQALLREPEISLKDWLINRFGQKLYDIYFGPYSSKLWGVDPSHVSSEWAPERVSVSSIGVVIQKLIAARGKTIKTYAREFLYPIGGIGRICEHMAQRAVHKGAKVFTGYNVSKIVSRPGGFLIEALDIEGKKKTFSSSRIISSMPLTELIHAISPAPAPEVLEAASHLRFRSVRFLNLMLDVPEVSKNTWLYVPEEKFIFFRLQEFTKWCPRNSPKGKTSFALELACQKGDDIWTMPDDELLHICLHDLKKMGIDLRGKVLGHFSTFAEHAYPFYSLGYKRHVQKLYRFFRDVDNILPCGRQGLFRYINMDIALENGFEAADALYDPDKRRHFLREKEDQGYVEAHLYLKRK